MKKGFALPLVIVLILVIIVFGVIYWKFGVQNQKASNETKKGTSKTQIDSSPVEDQTEIKVLGKVSEYKLGQPEFREDDVYFLESEGKYYKIVIPVMTNPPCEGILPQSAYDDVEVVGYLYGDEIICKPPKGYIRVVVPTKPRTVKSFIDSNGKERSIVLKPKDLKGSTTENYSYFYWDNIYISTKKDEVEGAIKIADVGSSRIGKSPYISTNTGTKYLIVEKQFAPDEPYDDQTFVLVNENGKVIKIDLSKMVLETQSRGWHGLAFGGWVKDTTNFKISACYVDGHCYEATFDATSGKQIDKTKVTS